MANGTVYLDALNTNSTNYKVKVRVMQKGIPQKSARNVLYQSVVFYGVPLIFEGNQMKGMLYGDEISGHQDALVCNGVYEIANAQVKPLLEQYRRDPAELPYTISFSRKTLIRPISTPGTFVPEYECVSQVPKTTTSYNIFDVIGTLLYVEPVAREVATKQDRKNNVREIIITDYGNDQPIVVSVWNELSGAECENLVSIVKQLPVVGFTGLRVTTYRGFSLAGTMSTTINSNHAGAKVDALVEWRNQNKSFLTDLQTRINRVRDPNTPISIVTLSTLKNKKAKNTLQDEKNQLKVTVPDPELQKLNAYLGCSNCGKKSDYASGETFRCNTCNNVGVISEPRVTFNCVVYDSTENVEITAFTADTVSLFQMSAADIFHLARSEDTAIFARVSNALKKEPFTIEISPKIALSRNNVLQWALRRVIASPSQNVELQQEATQDQPLAVTIEESVTAVARQIDSREILQDPIQPKLVEVAISTEYPTLQKLLQSITSTSETNRLQNMMTDTTKDVLLSTISTTSLSNNIPVPNAILPEVETTPNTPIIKGLKVEKVPAHIPETPTQRTPKRSNTRQAALSPSMKKSATGNSTTIQ